MIVFQNNTEENERVLITVIYLGFLLNWTDPTENEKLGRKSKPFWTGLVGSIRGMPFGVLGYSVF